MDIAGFSLGGKDDGPAGIKVPDDAGTFAGMTLDEVTADLCHVSKGDQWWSHRHALAFSTNGLNTALSSLFNQLATKRGPTTFVGWLKKNTAVVNYSHFVRRGGQPLLCETSPGVGDVAVNCWRPPPAVPDKILEVVRRKGVRLWTTIASDLCNGNKEQTEQLLDWAAFVAMAPGYKPGWSVVLYSSTQGIGKDMFVYGLSRTLGPSNSSTLGRKDLESSFNAYLAWRLVHVSDLHTTSRGSMNGSDIYESLKQPTSNLPPVIQINEKYGMIYNADNLCAWVISTNDEAPLAIPLADRRWYVVEGREDRREDAFYAEVSAWLKEPDTGHHIRGFLQLRWESMDAARRAQVHSIAPETSAKLHMVDASLSPVMTAIKEWFADKDSPDLLQLDDVINKLRDLKRLEILPRNAPLPNKTVLGVWMKTRFCAPQVPDKGPARLPDQTNVRVYAVKRAATYAPMSGREVGKLYVEQAAKARLLTRF